jgi:hypothetical protein
VSATRVKPEEPRTRWLGTVLALAVAFAAGWPVVEFFGQTGFNWALVAAILALSLDRIGLNARTEEARADADEARDRAYGALEAVREAWGDGQAQGVPEEPHPSTEPQKAAEPVSVPRRGRHAA